MFKKLFSNLFKKDIQVLMVTGEKVEKIYSIFRMKLAQVTIIILLSLCIVFYVFLQNFVLIPKLNIVQMDIEQLNEYINEDKAKLVYNYIKENGLTDYDDLEEIDGVSVKTIDKLEKFTYIKGVD